jgi:alanine racemase
MLKWIEIDLGAIRENCRLARSLLSPGVQFRAVVKADGYGHGAIEVARAATREGADSIGVLTVDEAAALRRARIQDPIHLLAPPLPDEADQVAALDLVPTVDSGALLTALNRAVAGPLPVTVDMDFGLGRWGIPRRDLSRFLKEVARHKKLRVRGISTHLDYVPGQNAVEAEEKLRAFAGCVRKAKAYYPRAVGEVANSSILLDFPQWQMDGVRIGNILYGINPTSRPLALQNPWRFFARIISITGVSKGTALGYGSEYIAPRAMKVAALPAGYADGLTMEPVERLIGFGRGYRYWGLLGGREVPFIGRCGIAHVLIDVTAVPSARVGDAVLLPIRRTAANARIPRIYKK